MEMNSFKNVTVCFPAGAGAFQAKDTLHNATWVLWSSGELRVDTATFGLFFAPGTGGRLSAKALGCLTGAVPAPPSEPSGPQTVVASTSDPVHSLIRLGFERAQDEEAFVALAQAAEAAHASSYSSPTGRRSTFAAGRRSTVTGRPQEGGAESLAGHLSPQCPGSWPLVCGGVELYGPDPQGEVGSEVLLARGAVALLDPPAEGRVGSYELLFCEDGCVEPCLRLPIGPRTHLARQTDEGSSTNRRLSARLSLCSGRASCLPSVFSLTLPGAPGWALAFDTETDAAGFERDFAVRQRLVALSLRTSRGRRAMGELQGELTDLRRYGLLATLRWLVMQALVVILLGLMLYAGLLYSGEPDRPLPDLAVLVLQDASAAAVVLGERAKEAGTALCGVISSTVPSASLSKCMSMPDAVDARACAVALLGAVQ